MTNPLPLDKWCHNDFEAGQTDDYHVTAKDVGEILMVFLKNDGGGLYSDWFVNRVKIKCKAQYATYDFPCNQWVQDEVVIFEGTGKRQKLLGRGDPLFRLCRYVWRQRVCFLSFLARNGVWTLTFWSEIRKG